MSHPTWVRGLKHKVNRVNKKATEVAPYVGAWIETLSRCLSLLTLSRTLRGCVD